MDGISLGHSASAVIICLRLQMNSVVIEIRVASILRTSPLIGNPQRKLYFEIPVDSTELLWLHELRSLG